MSMRISDLMKNKKHVFVNLVILPGPLKVGVDFSTIDFRHALEPIYVR